MRSRVISRPARSEFFSCAASIRALARPRNVRHVSTSAAISPQITISLRTRRRCNAAVISLSLKRDFCINTDIRIAWRRLISELTQTSTSFGAAARAVNSSRWAAARNFFRSPCGLSTIPPPMVCRSDRSRITNRSPIKARIGDSNRSCAIAFSPRRRASPSRKATFAATRAVP